MRRLMIVVGVVIIAAGITEAGGLAFLHDEAPPPREGGSAEVVCVSLGTVVRTDRVRAMPDGVHLRVANAAGAEVFAVRSSTDELLAQTPIQTGATNDLVLAIPPGAVTVACLPSADDSTARSAGVLTVLPTARWITPDLACGDDVDRAEVRLEESQDEAPGVTAHHAVPGLRPSDDLRRPGYPETRWHGDLLTVVREGETIARITRAEDRGGWSVVITACRHTGLLDR